MEAAAAQDVGRLACHREELLCQPRLPDPGRAEQREHVADALRDDVLERCSKSLLLADATDERRFEMTRERVGRRVHRDEPERGHRLALPLQLERLDRLHGDGVAHERQRRSADQDLARWRGLLQPGRHVDGVARHERLAFAGHDLAGIDAGTEGEGDGELLSEPGQPLADLGHRAHRTQRIVLVGDRDPEHRHRGVSDELLDRAAVPLHDQADLLEVAPHRPSHRLRVEPLAQGGRSGHVTEDDGDGLSHLARCGRRRERSSARAAELEPVRALGTARRADDHELSLTRLGRCRRVFQPAPMTVDSRDCLLHSAVVRSPRPLSF